MKHIIFENDSTQTFLKPQSDKYLKSITMKGDLMTPQEIADYIVDNFKTDSGIVLGIPIEYQDTLKALLKLAVTIARQEPPEEMEG